MVSIASAARKAASCHAPKLQNLIAAPPLENRMAAAMIFDRGLMAPRRERGIYASLVWMKFPIVTASVLSLTACTGVNAARVPGPSPSHDSNAILAEELSG